MYPISDKNFLEFFGKPLILLLLENAYKGGLDNFIIVGNDENIAKIQQIKDENEFLKTAIITKQKDLTTGMAGGVLAGLEFVKDNNELFILGGNDFIKAEIYSKILKNSRNFDGGILAKKIENYFPGGYLEFNKNSQKINSIIEKPGAGNEPSKYINIVAHYFKKAENLNNYLNKANLEKRNQKNNSDNIYEIALDKCFKNHHFKAVEYDNYWQAIKYPWHVLKMQELLFKNINDINFAKKPKNLANFKEINKNVWVHKTATVVDTARIRGENIVIEAGVRVFDNAVISSNSYIGEKTIIGNNALVRDSIIGKNSAIGFNTEIARSFLASNVSTHIAYIGDSVVDSFVNFGAYTCTANLRLDKKNIKVTIKNQRIDSEMDKLGSFIKNGVQIGIGAKLMPGTIVVNHVLPGEIIK